MRGLLGRQWAHLARAWPAAAVTVALIALWSWVVPSRPRNPLAETALFSVLLIAALVGWGSLVRGVVARAERVDLGLRAVWGVAAVALVGGALMSVAAMTRTAALVVVDIGTGLTVVAALRERRAIGDAVAAWVRAGRREPLLVAVAMCVAGLVALACLAGIADWHTNPYDDDVAYSSFTRELLDTGTFLQPFSIRRLGAFGGQTLFDAIVGLRAAASQGHTFDKCVSVGLVLLLLVGHRDGRARPTVLALLLGAALIVTTPNVSINTASYYSGVALMLGLVRTLHWAGEAERPAWRVAVPVAFVAAATCTLRHNYIATVGALLAVSYGSWAWRTRRAPGAALREGLLVGGLMAAALAPWAWSSWQSNATPLYPLVLGTANRGMLFNASGSSAADELKLAIDTVLDATPIKSIGLFALAAALLHERSPRRPIGAFLVATGFGFATLIHGLTASDPPNIGRYAFAAFATLALVVLLAASTRRSFARGGREHAFVGIALFAALVALLEARDHLRPFLDRSLRNVAMLGTAAPRGPSTLPPEADLYRRLQEAVPPGERIAVALDEPYWLNYARNPIWNLDMVGFSSVAPGMPFFQGSRALEEYLRKIGVRYLAFVEPGFSRYYFRRDYWVELINNELEVWRAQAPYVVDFIDNVGDIAARHRRAFRERGMTVVDLEETP